LPQSAGAHISTLQSAFQFRKLSLSGLRLKSAAFRMENWENGIVLADVVAVSRIVDDGFMLIYRGY
jgi:hypothetical protein